MGDSRDELLIEELRKIVEKLETIKQSFSGITDPTLATRLISKSKSIIIEFDGEDSKFIKDIEAIRNKYDTLVNSTFQEIKGVIQGFYDLCNEKIISRYKVQNFSLKYDKILGEIDFGSDTYRDVVSEINNTYKYGFFTSMYILIRKLLENLIYDCLKKYYGMANIDKFFNEGRTKHHGFSTLRINFDALIKEPDFIAMVGMVDQKFIDLLGEFKDAGNANAHSLFNFPHQGFVEEKKEEIDILLTRLKNILEILKKNDS